MVKLCHKYDIDQFASYMCAFLTNLPYNQTNKSNQNFLEIFEQKLFLEYQVI